MRNTSDTWAPPIYKRLISNDRKERDMAERCLLKLKSVIYPPLPNLSKVVSLDIKKNLLSNMLVMVEDCQKIVPMIRAWGWYISLIGPDSVKYRSIINQMLKIPEQTFTNHSPQVQIASLVSWEQLIDAFLPHTTNPELKLYDPVNGLLKRLVEVIREGIDSSILTSRMHQVSLDLKYIKEMELCKDEGNKRVETLNVSSLVYKDMVSPMVYIAILDLCLISETVERTLITQLGVQHAIKHAKLLLFSENPLLSLQATISFLYTHSRKSTDKRFCSLITWRIVAKSLHETIGTMCNKENSIIIFKFLCYPFVVLLNSSEASVYRRTSRNSDMCLVSSHKEVEFELIIEAWKLLLDSLSICTKDSAILIDNLSNMLVEVLDSTPRSSWNFPKFDFLMMCGELIICILNQTPVMHDKNENLEVTNQNDNCQNSCTPFFNTFNLVSRFMKMALIHFRINHEATENIFCRLLAALNYLISHIFSVDNVMLLVKLISDPFAAWLSLCIDLSAEAQQRSSSIMHQSECLLNHLFDCFRRSSDSVFLGIQNSILQSSLDHPHRPICDLATKFWNEIHDKDVESNYPHCLLRLDKLSGSGLNVEPKPPFISANDCSKSKKVAALSQIQNLKRMKSKITRRPSNTKGKLECQNSDYLLNKFRRA